MTDGLLADAIAKMKTFGIVYSGDATAGGIGSMSEKRWKTFFDTMASEGLYPKSLSYRNAYDLRFVEAGTLSKPPQGGR
jgi:NitT/TauT family transport system substrate-binding protein